MKDSLLMAFVLGASICANALLEKTSLGGELCCALCGCKDSCQKVCRLVCEDKKVDVICWGVKCEDFCVPGPSKPCCKQCDMICDDCNKKPKEGDPIATPKRFVWREWIPSSCANIFTKKKLMQRIDTKKVPSYKWVVEDLCAKCESKTKSASVEPGVNIPAPPAVDAKILVAQHAETTVK
jgi:hypothetical protein